MKKDFWVIVTIISVFMGFLVGYSISSYTAVGGQGHVEESGGYSK
ncbi:MAG: hypothetical protein IEMM0002_1487 [bacterium]|nr:MAG: hypothetical protein IEMM0002_1487 [bacterium]